MTAGYLAVPLDGGTDRQRATVANGILAGRMNVTGTVTLTANIGTTTVSDSRVGPASFIGLMPQTQNATTEIANGTAYVSSQGKQTFTITHANAATTDRTFTYVVVG